MRHISDSVLQMLASRHLSVFYLVDIDTDTPMKHTSFYRDIVTPFGTYSADNNLIGVDSPRLDANIDRESYKILYADPSFSLRSLAEGGISGIPVKVRIGFLNTLDVVVNGVMPNQPFTGADDFLTSYDGVIDFPSISIQDENVHMIFECASPMASLGLIKSHFTSQDYLKHLDTGDTSFDQVYDGSHKIDLLWGKK